MPLSALHRQDIGLEAAPFIDGRYVGASGLAVAPHVNPSTGEVQAELHLGGAKEIDLAVRAAKAAQVKWMAMTPYARIACFKRLHALLGEHAVQLGFLGARESGIPVGLNMTAMAQSWIDYYMGWVDKVEGTYIPESFPNPGFSYIRREPYGVIGVIIPWNGPLVASCMMAIPALAAGNGVVMKPPALSPFVALRIGELIAEAGFPTGLYNVVPGEAEAGEALVAHADIGKIAFTGGEATARRVMVSCAAFLKPVAFELGGKSANIVFADADLDAAALQAVYGSLGLSGQGCVNPTRLLVHASIYDDMIARAAALAGSIPVGDPFAEGMINGPVICQAACDRILGIIGNAKTEGRLVAGGERLGGDLEGGFFISPAVFADVRQGAAVEQNEVFGPVLSVIRFETDEEALSIANGTRYGLGAYLHTSDLDRAHDFAERLQAGYVNVNGFAMMAPMSPFGGYKQSGFGRVGGWAGMEEYLQTKNVFIARRQLKA
jgi:aldehyde dehydrogenase (NAD+)